MRRNDEVARRLEEFADLLEASDVEYKPRAYRRAAENIREHPVDIEELVGEGEKAVADIDRVGDAISSKVVEYIETGEIAELAELRADLPVEMDALTSVEGVGPKTVGTLYDELGIRTLDDLEAAAEAGRIREVKGFGPKTEGNIREGIAFARQAHERQLLGEALPRGERVREFLSGMEAVKRCALAGSLRRWRPTIGDVDVLAGSDEPDAVVEAFTNYQAATDVIEAGTVKASIRVESVRVDLRVVDDADFGAALQYFTGSKDHNVAVRNRAIERDLKVNEYGVFDVSGLSGEEADDQRAGERSAGETERGMYEALDMAWPEPELRENRGEVEAAASGELPDLVTVEDVRGDLHVHTDWSDGNNTISEMVAGAAEFGHEYVCLTDHATGPGMVGGVGLDDDELREQLAEIRAVADDADIDVFAGVEANVDIDGGISVGDDLLADLDVVVASPHSGLDGDGTERLVAAAEHPGVDVIGHPTGRLLNSRAGMNIDVERLATVAADQGTALEINADPRRLDLTGRLVKTAIDAGATVAVNTDAHAPANYGYVRYGVHTARRGWAEADDVLNTREVDGLRSFLE
ncbi:DNA polymerase/3'-5' exonuclease PolX [Halobacteriales archaeon QH_2_65_14]|nr:MAG: DNA polymerase/3'-5' exonuclease PolX [Halobacteriales archaeon QH_2_65_14]